MQSLVSSLYRKVSCLVVRVIMWSTFLIPLDFTGANLQEQCVFVDLALLLAVQVDKFKFGNRQIYQKKLHRHVFTNRNCTGTRKWQNGHQQTPSTTDETATTTN